MQLETFAKGKGAPLLFLGGANTSFQYYEKFIDLLSKGFKVYFFNYPGIGKSTTPKEHTLEVYLGAIEKVVKDNKLRNYHLAGASFGGYLAIEYVNHAKIKPKSLILFSPLTKTIGVSAIENALRVSATQVQKWRSREDALTGNIFSPRQLQYARNKLRHSSFILKQIFTHEHIPNDIPILVVLGEKDMVVDSEFTKKVFENKENAKIVTVSQKGHEAFAIIGDRVVQLINDFLTANSQ